MFDNIGGKIKILAKVLCWIGIIASLIIAIVLWTQNSYNTPTVALGFGVLTGGCISAWVGSFFMYGFGELIEETTLTRQINQQILQHLDGSEEKESSPVELSRSVPLALGRERATQLAKASSDRWKCTKCGSLNDRWMGMCKDCGAYK